MSDQIPGSPKRQGSLFATAQPDEKSSVFVDLVENQKSSSDGENEWDGNEEEEH